MKRGSFRTACCLAIAILFTLDATAFAQMPPPVESVPPPAPAYPPPQYPPPQYPPPQYPAVPPPAYPPVGPARLHYNDGDPVPAGYRVVHRSIQGLVIAGTVVFCVSYGIALSVAMIDDFEDQTSWLAVPIAGPWLMMWNRSRPDCDQNSGSGCVDRSLETILRFYLAVDGVAQAAGALMLAFGVAGRNILVRDYGYASLHLTPGPIGRDGYGAMLSGRF